MKSEVTKEQIHSFLNGYNPMERILKIEGDYNSDKMCVIYRDEKGIKKVSHEPFYPFCWAKQSVGRGLFGGDRTKIKAKLQQYHISCKGLRISDSDGNVPERMERGYRVLFKATTPMSYQKFMQFFKEGGRPIYPNQSDDNYGLKEFIVVNPIEQFMIETGKRQFKGYDDYDELLRMEFDLETEGLEPQKDCISQIGIRTNKGFEKIIPILGKGEEKFNNEIKALQEFFEIIYQLKPDVITGHNIENFDWWFIDERLKLRDSSLEKFTENIFPRKGIYRANKQKVLKLGGEMEYYTPTIMWGTVITDSLFAVRRAQALNSNIKKADLKYITKFAKLNKPNRVYVPGKIINTTWEDEKKRYAHNDENGHWFKITKSLLEKTFVSENDEIKRYELLDNNQKLFDKKENETFNIVSGRYIVERYLLDDLYETDKVELSFNQTNYQICKMLPVPFEKMCTMGTAAIWKYIMCTWSFENNLAIPELIDTHSFTGGLSRLLVTGFVDRILKLDFGSLYPSIILTFNIKSDIDIMGVMLMMLEYILTKREEYKGEKKTADKKVREIIINLENQTNNIDLNKELKKYKSLFTLFDNMQSSIKVIGNGYFGSFSSAGVIFPWSDLKCGEETTCTGRMALRLMIGWFTNIGYRPLVGDSFTGDTPLFIKENETGYINIKPISELINEEEINKDVLGREYDYSKKDYKVLCRSGWVEPSYIYRHKTEKPIYRVEDDNMTVDVTEDHSLFDSEQNKIKPSEIKEDTKLEYYENEIHTNIFHSDDNEFIKGFAERTNPMLRIPQMILNADKETRSKYLYYLNDLINKLNENGIEITCSKTFIAGYNFIQS